MTFGDWEPRRRIEETYRRELQKLIDRFAEFLAPLSITDPMEILSRLSEYFGADAFHDAAYAAASRMITGLFVDGAKTWREASRESMRGREIYQALQYELQGPIGHRVRQLVQENARFITMFNDSKVGNGRTLATQVADFVNAEAYKGRRASAIAQDLAKQFDTVARGRIDTLARTECSKASTDLTEARSREFGWPIYIWHCCRDARTRKAHRLMDNVIVFWNDPPAPESFMPGLKSTLGHYHAGKCPNCRCYPAPQWRLDRIDWPHKVYRNGIIRPMTQSAFARISGIEVRRAA